MNYPLLILKKNDSNIYAIDKMYGIVSVGGESFYEKATIIDSEGNVYNVNKVEIEKRAKLIYCLIYFQKLLELKISLSFSKKLELNELKEMLIDKISKNPKKWLSMGTVDGITNSINSVNNINELIIMFK